MRVHAIVEDLETARRAVEAGATVVQLRVKAPTAEVVARGRGLRRPRRDVRRQRRRRGGARARRRRRPPRPGRPGRRARAGRGLLLGRSASTFEQAVDGATPTTSASGPIWATPSKDDADPPLGLDGLARICARRPVPVVAIGGIDASNAAACIRAGAAGVAVIRAATDPGAAAGGR